MTGLDSFTQLTSRVRRYLWAFAAAWTLIAGTLLLHNIYDIKKQTREIVKKEALVHFNKDVASRLWASSHGGVYVPVTDKTPPNPFLSQVPERDVKTPSGKALTLMNPAYMIRQMMEHYADLYGVRGHITSLKYFRKETAPDEWERSALISFEKGATEVCGFVPVRGVEYFRLMRPLFAEEQCLKCHGAQGYKVGDIRGGVSVSVPVASYLKTQRREILTHTISLTILWLLGLAGIGLAVRGLKTNLRERESAEALLAESRENYCTLVESSLTGIYIIQDGIIRFANNRAAEIYGYSKDELIGMDSLAVVHPEDRGFVKGIRDRRMKGEEVPSEYQARGIRKDGATIWVQRRNVRCEYNGKPAILGNVLDVTALKRAQDESEARAKELARSNRELDQFAAVASHDLSEPLRKIRAFGAILKDQYHRVLDDEGKDYLEKMQKAAERMQNMINALLSYSRLTTKAQPFTRVDLADSVREALSNLEILIQKTGGRIQLEDLPVLDGEPSQMMQLFQNLIGNGLKFHRKEDPPVIQVRAQMEPPSEDPLHGQYGPNWKIHVEDNGIGFDEKQLDRIFLPFERLHGRGAYEGAGMGLAICRKIVERHGGTITATSTPGAGSTFIVTLPEGRMQFNSESSNHS
jgi:chemotaxis family two-component system sensor kinase Cph1